MIFSDNLTYADLDVLVREHGRMVVCTVIRAQGSVPRRVGSRMAVLPNGEIRGTIGGGLYEALVVSNALATLADGKSRVKTYDFREVGASENAFGAICGGQTDLFFEVVSMPDHLLIVGGGHCGRALARAAVLLGDFDVTLVDDRLDYIERGDLPESVTISLSSASFETLPSLVRQNTYIVLVSQGFVTDQAALRQVISLEVPYIGMMGSRKKVRTVLAELTEEGISPERLSQVNAPIGLPIGSETPAEIAVSILAQIISIRSSKVSK